MKELKIRKNINTGDEGRFIDWLISFSFEKGDIFECVNTHYQFVIVKTDYNYNDDEAWYSGIKVLPLHNGSILEGTKPLWLYHLSSIEMGVDRIKIIGEIEFLDKFIRL